jgi:hypothetical protein
MAQRTKFMKTFIIPDIHGHYETLKSLLREAGVLVDENGELSFVSVPMSGNHW